jgi:hypothetical protein
MDESAISDGASTGCSGNLCTSVVDDSGKSIVDGLGSGCTSVGVSDTIVRVSDGSTTFAMGSSTSVVFDVSGGIVSKDFSTDF